ncbi:HDIG domain-containing protein [Candidatus Gottesmanbacteria bacterium]|nr:HDIG domain-containing protein [Candidatus Gottesmanbacteria bacterium]
MTRDEAYTLVTEWTKNQNLVKHMLAVEAIMCSLARHFSAKGGSASGGSEFDEEVWGLAGLLHDADYELYKDTDPKKHPSKIFEELQKRHADRRIIDAIKSHAWGWREDLPEPKTNMQWSLFCCDDLSGYIIACALVRPDPSASTSAMSSVPNGSGQVKSKLQSLTVESLQKKWGQKSFASGVKREHAQLCQEKLDINLEDFMTIALKAMQDIHEELDL